MHKEQGIFRHSGTRDSDEDGSLVIEFSLVFPVFVFLVFFVFEICRYLFISAAIDATLSSAARTSSSQASTVVDYNLIFRDTIRNESALWAGLIDASQLTTHVSFCSSVTQAIADSCSETASSGKVLAYYQVKYNYRPYLFNGVIPGTEDLIAALQSSLSRQLIYVQEYERDQIFKNTPPSS
ncbi:TadE/TadG family type IV pilus assembly protein [Pantoea sp. BAV 3049]|uniref:TadE/TadG family type IV pilus assembly protein n=1 Tax=Pantoea sp. BAV 3049 TaxID=2654188 RepID=UPI00131E3E82|nr:TadE/TadG family type IV pilus assembly protein [Pantoea sp. BAV 3049]